ncbi:MAG: YfhO family protein [Candidatus Hydrogenedens sp.]|nr:YfhO family protein [Candidatus Hydrogenedens sp.]
MPHQRRVYLEAFICLAVLFIVPAVLLYPVVKGGSLPFDLSELTLRAPWQEARESGFHLSKGESSTELVQRYFPWYVYLNESALLKKLPLWNPYEGCGIPFLALWRTRVFSVFSLPLYVFPLAAALGVSVFLKSAAAGLFAYFAARKFHFSPSLALVAGFGYQLSGILLVGHWLPVSDLVPLFPLLLVAMQALLLGQYRIWPVLALLLGVMALAGGPDGLVAMLLFLMLLIPVYRLRTREGEGYVNTFLILLISGLLALCLAALQVLPYAEFLNHGYLENNDLPLIKVRDLSLILLSPQSLAGNAAGKTEAALWLPSCVMGFLLLPLWFALRSFALRIRKRRVEAFLLTAVLFAFLGMFITPHLRQITGLSFFDSHYFLLPIPLAFFFLTATTAEEWLRLNLEQCKTVLKRLKYALPVFYGLSFFIALLMTRHKLQQLPHFLPALLLCLLLVVIFGITLLKPRVSWLVTALCILLFLGSWRAYQPLSHYTSVEQAIPDTLFTRSLCKENIRISGTDKLAQWPLSIHGISQSYSPSGVHLKRLEEFNRQAASQPELLRLTASSQLVLTKQDILEGFSLLRPVLNIQDVFPSGAVLLRDLNTYPFARVSNTARPLDMEKDNILRASGPPLVESDYIPVPGNDTGKNTRVQVEHLSSDKIDLRLDGAQSGILVVANSWYPGWYAELNGQDNPLFPVDIAFQGVELMKGSQRVTLTYRPQSFTFGLYISVGTLLLLLLGVLYYLRGQKQS